MLALILSATLSLLPGGPQRAAAAPDALSAPAPTAADPWVAEGGHPDHPRAVVVRGAVELRPAAADRAAERQALDELRWDLERDARRVVAARAPAWLPAAVSARVTDRWLRALDAGDVLRIIDRERVSHDHGDYRSFQTHLLVEYHQPRLERALGALEARLTAASRHTVWFGVGTLGLWGLLGLAWLWFDRLTRGYMTWRLAAVFGGMAVAIPGSASFWL